MIKRIGPPAEKNLRHPEVWQAEASKERQCNSALRRGAAGPATKSGARTLITVIGVEKIIMKRGLAFFFGLMNGGAFRVCGIMSLPPI